MSVIRSEFDEYKFYDAKYMTTKLNRIKKILYNDDTCEYRGSLPACFWPWQSILYIGMVFLR